jgi:ABC-2 type transport system permease protein
MTDRDAIRLVARREISSRVRERSFLISTLVTIAILLFAGAAPALLGGDGDDAVTVAVTGERTALQTAETAKAGGDAYELDVTVRRVNTAREARALVDDEDADAAIVGGALVTRDASDDLVLALQAAHAEVERRAALEAAGVRGADADRVLAPRALRVSEVGDQDDDEQTGIASIAVILLYGQLLMFGYWIAAGIVEEKSSRVVEVLLAAIRPRALLTGKLLGIGLLGFVQLLVVGILGAGMTVATGALDVPSGAWRAVGIVLAFFVLGYALYAAMFAVAGAIVPRQEDLQSSTTPLTIIILVSFFAAISATGDPGGTLAQVLTFVPFSAPMVVPVRLIAGEMAAWEVVLSVLLIVGTAAALLAAAIRIYTNAILRTGGRVKLADAWRAT